VTRGYPKELAERVRAAWPDDARALPDRLESLLDVAYHASFLREEERLVTCRILVLPASELREDVGPPRALLPLGFDVARAYDEHELRRLSPAAEVHRAFIAVDDAGADFAIWGIVQSGPRWLRVAQGGRAKEPPVPHCLVVRILRPGHLRVSCGARTVAELRGGRVLETALDVFESRWLPDRFRDVRALMAKEHADAVKLALDEPSAMRLTGYLAQQMVKRIVSTMQAAHHGGTIVIGPPTCAAEHLNVKYNFSDAPMRRHFRALALSALDVIAKEAIETRGEPFVLYQGSIDARIAEIDEGLFELGHLIANLAATDGAVVLTKRFEILGFGAEIAGNLPVVTEVRRATDLEGTTFALEGVDGVGTRHRSAYRLCAASPEILSVVVSQDGGVRFVASHPDVVTYWDHGLGD
jgi:hypothetical protein